MNRLVIIGNGFDLAHGLKTSYANFINWYWDQRRDGLYSIHSNVSEDALCSMVIKDSHYSWANYAWSNSNFKDIRTNKYLISGINLINELKENPVFKINCCPFFESIQKSIETKGWVDIENEYYRLLKEQLKNNESCQELNNQLRFLQNLLIEYLKSLDLPEQNKLYLDCIIDYIKPEDVSNEGTQKAHEDVEARKVDESIKWLPEQIMLLSFNYTPTTKLYNNYNVVRNFIHGTLDKPESIIFGFGDELDKDYKELQEANDNELLTNVKSVKYLEAPNYRDLLRFIESAPFQVLIMGHSCGLSDRTLLNTIFEHNNCVSIKPFYYVKEDGTDNYLELVQNISRNFTDMKLFRDRVVNKTQCEQM